MNFDKDLFKKRLKFFFYLFLTLIVTLVAILFIYIGWFYNKRTNYEYDRLKEYELSYWKCKSEIIDEMETYISSKVSYHNLSTLELLSCCDKYNVDVRLPLAQGLIESHYGTAGLAEHTNSVFNMGAFDGTKLDDILGIYRYSHPNQSIEPYLKLLRNNYLGNIKTEYDLMINFVNLNGERYASFSKYEIHLRHTWNEINEVTKLDSLLQVYQYLRIELNR